MSEPFEFEGDEVTDFTAQLPSASLEAPQAYPRGTILNLSVQVRVKSVRLDEDRKGNLSRKHILALEDVSILDVLTPAQRKALIEAAEQQAVQEQESTTITEEQHIEDVLPGQTTIEEQLADAEPVYGGDDVIEARNEAMRNWSLSEQAAADELRGEKVAIDDDATDLDRVTDDEDDDPEHAWMDEEEDFAHGLRVEVGY